jgi:hypothetical protein
MHITGSDMIEQVQKFSQRARAFMCAYLALEKQEETIVGDINGEKSAPVKIEQMVKQFNTHRCAFDFDRGFINSVIVMQEEDKAEEAERTSKHR